MALRAAVLLFVAFPACWAADARESAKVTPIQKVIQMLNDMIAKGKAEKEDEATKFAAYQQFCHQTTNEKTRSISKATEDIEELKADIGQADADAMVLAKDIGALDGDIATWEEELKEQTWQREKAHADFKKIHTELTESVSAVERAVETIKKGPGAFAQESLIQLSSNTRVPAKSRSFIMSFLQRPDTHTQLMQDMAEVDAKGPALEGQSGGVVEMVEGLGEKFETERDTAEKEEMEEKHAFDMMAQDLTDQIDGATKNREKKAAIKATKEQAKAEGEGDLAETSATLAEDQKFLQDLTAECEQKAIDFEQRQKIRQEEIEAINKAIEIMSSPEVSGGAAFPQTGLSLAQLRSSSRVSTKDIAADFLADRARLSGSRVLSFIAIKAQSDPFKKVTKMIKDMIEKLMQEAADEAEHKGFCDEEMGTNEATRNAKSDEVAGLTATIEELGAAVAKLGEEIAGLGKAISESDAAMAKATALRTSEKEKNTATIADAKVAQEATQKALTVLKEFYDKAATATALAQKAEKPTGGIQYDERALAIIEGGNGASLAQVPGAPEMADGAYTGMGNGGVMGMLEVIESDFARLISETTASEAEAAKEYETFSNDSAEDKEVMGTDMKTKEGDRTRKESEMATAKKDMAGSQEELDAALAYFEKLKPSCVDAGETYEERVARRKEEIESLKEALKILSGDDIA